MANRTAWVAGNGAGLTWTSAVSAANVATLANGSCILDSTDQTNGTSLDIYADLSISCTIASSTIAAGAAVSFWIWPLNQDGTTYGDGHLTANTASATTPGPPADAVIACYAAATQTTILGMARGIIIPPGTFRWVVQNNCGFTWTAATIKYRTYNIQLNN